MECGRQEKFTPTINADSPENDAKMQFSLNIGIEKLGGSPAHVS